MSLTAEDIQTKQFHVRFRGFDIEEVDTFLERIAENFVLLNEEKKELKEKVEKLEMEINKFYSQEKTFQHAILSAQRIADEMQEKSRQEANSRRTAVLDEIDRMRKKGIEEREALQQEIDALQENRNKVREELRTYLQTYLSWLDQNDSLAENTPLSLLQSDILDKRAAPDDGKEDEAILQVDQAAIEVDGIYEKINLPDDQQEEMASALDNDQQPEETEDEEDGERLTMPDLEGDMLFALEDPLDEEEDKEKEQDMEPSDDKFFHDIKLK